MRLGALRVESLFRETNDGLARAYARDARGADAYVCECGDTSCTDAVFLTRPEYDAVRAHPTRFAIAIGHESIRFERVVSVTARFSVVEKPVSL